MYTTKEFLKGNTSPLFLDNFPSRLVPHWLACSKKEESVVDLHSFGSFESHFDVVLKLGIGTELLTSPQLLSTT